MQIKCVVLSTYVMMGLNELAPLLENARPVENGRTKLLHVKVRTLVFTVYTLNRFLHCSEQERALRVLWLKGELPLKHHLHTANDLDYKTETD